MRAQAFIGLVLVWLCNSALAADPPRRSSPLHLADYDAELRRPDGHVDADAMVKRLSELGVTTYYWLVWHGPTDWEDLKEFLPKAKEANLQVWVYLVPPSESPPQYGNQYSEPFRLDYMRWAEEIARLSLLHTNLSGWVIDDFYANHDLFSPAYLKDMQARAKSLNPALRFLPLMYFNEITRDFVEKYHSVIDGVVVAYPQDAEEIRYARAILNGETIAMPGQLSCAWNTPTSAGDFVAARLQARVGTNGVCRLRFRQQDDFTGPTDGYHFKQVLVDGRVIWEEDVAGGTLDWQDTELDISAATRAKTNVMLELRLEDKKGVSNFGVRWALRDLRAEGLVPGATLNEPRQWTVTNRGPLEAGFGEAAQTHEPRFNIPFIVMTAADAGEFRQRHGQPASAERISEWLGMSLRCYREGTCDGVVTYCLDKAAGSQTFQPSGKLFRTFKPLRTAAMPGRMSEEEAPWRALPLIVDGQISPGWLHVGWGGFVTDGDSLRTDCSPKGLGLLVYTNEHFGDCQIRVVFKPKDSRCNSGFIVRLDDGIPGQVDHPGAAFDRNNSGKISTSTMNQMITSAERDEGPWFAVHHGYEVQIMDANDPIHRTGAIYSLATSSAVTNQNANLWRTMIITLKAESILVDVDGKRVTSFDSSRTAGTGTRKWFEPKREPKRPIEGFLALQNHDPGDVVWFKEVSVRPLRSTTGRE